MPYTEDTLVQQTTAEFMEKELGWTSVLAFNNEDFRPDSILGRTSDREVVLPLRHALLAKAVAWCDRGWGTSQTSVWMAHPEGFEPPTL